MHKFHLPVHIPNDNFSSAQYYQQFFPIAFQMSTIFYFFNQKLDRTLWIICFLPGRNDSGLYSQRLSWLMHEDYNFKVNITNLTWA